MANTCMGTAQETQLICPYPRYLMGSFGNRTPSFRSATSKILTSGKKSRANYYTHLNCLASSPQNDFAWLIARIGMYITSPFLTLQEICISTENFLTHN